MNRLPNVFPIILMAAFLGLPALSLRLQPGRYEGGRSQSESEQKRRNASSTAIIMGEVRTNLADMLYIKTERYMHSGVAYEPHINEGSTSSREAGHEEESDNSGGTIIRSKAEDFRGLIGYLERQVKPYLPPNAHAKHVSSQELLPWYRLMTLSDPHNLRAYQLGAWQLQNISPESAQQGIQFLDEGIKYNPEAFQLYLTKGYIYTRGLNDEASAYKEFLEAARLAAAQRPPRPEQDPLEWTEYMEEDAAAAMRMAVLMEHKMGDVTVALELARRYNAILEGDGVLLRQIAIMESETSQPNVEGPPPPGPSLN